MANTLAVLARRILAGAQDVLEQEFALPQLIGTDFRNTSMQRGDPISVAKAPVAVAAASITPAATPPAIVDTVRSEISYSMDNWYAPPMCYLTAQDEQKLTESEAFVPLQVKEMARSLIAQINTTALAKYKKFYGYAGTAGTNPLASNTDPIADVAGVLDNQLVPDMGQRKAVVNNAAYTAGRKLNEFKLAYQRGDTDNIRKGVLGETLGFEIWRDSQVPSHTAGTITTGLITKASTAVAAGLATFVGTTAASTGACALLVGDVIAIAGHTTTYVLTAAATQASAATDVTLAFDPPLERALVGSETITVKATHRVNLAFDPSAFALTMAYERGNSDGAMYTEQYQDPKTGIPLTLKAYGGYHVIQWELSAFWGIEVVDPRKGARLAG